MANRAFNKNEDFVVRESAGLNFIIAIFCWGVLISVIASYSSTYSDSDTLMSLIGGIVSLIAAILFTIKGVKRKECIRINRNGFFYFRKYITDWESLQSAQLTQDEKVVTIQDNFVLILKYTKEEKSLMRKIALTNTQDKSEEEILAAIRFYSSN